MRVSVCVSVCLSVCLSGLFVCVSVCLACLSVCLSVPVRVCELKSTEWPRVAMCISLLAGRVFVTFSTCFLFQIEHLSAVDTQPCYRVTVPVSASVRWLCSTTHGELGPAYAATDSKVTLSHSGSWAGTSLSSSNRSLLVQGGHCRDPTLHHLCLSIAFPANVSSSAVAPSCVWCGHARCNVDPCLLPTLTEH